VALGWPNAPLTAAAVAAPNADGTTTFFDFSGQGTREMTGVRYILFSLKKKKNGQIASPLTTYLALHLKKKITKKK
jgi:hypothetical protein